MLCICVRDCLILAIWCLGRRNSYPGVRDHSGRTYICTWTCTFYKHNSPTHSLTHPLTHSLTHSLTHLLSCSPTHSATHPPTHSPTLSLLQTTYAHTLPGVYNIKSTIRITPMDSHLTIQNYEGEEVWFSGGKTLETKVRVVEGECVCVCV